jgi:hypothetical protein
MNILLIIEHDCLKANRESLGGMCPIPLPGKGGTERSAKISQTIDRFYNFTIFQTVLAISKCLVFIIRKEDVRVYIARY